MDRSVANLTTEQLYRKRAFDRINQRQSRARKKTRITELEEELAELKQRLTQSEDHVKRLQSSEAALRKVIESARSSLQLLDTSESVEEGQIPSPPSSTSANVPVMTDYSSMLDSSISSSASQASESTAVSNSKSRTMLDSSSGSLPALALRDENTGLTLGFPLSNNPPIDSMFYHWDDGSDLNAMNAVSLAFLDTSPAEPAMDSWLASPKLQSNLQVQRLDMPPRNPQWERLPPHIGASCRLDTVLLGLFQSNRQQAQNSTTIAELSAPAFPSIASLLNPEIQSAQSPISSAIGQHGRITMEVPSLPIKLAMMYNMCVFLRWLISPTRRNYDALPEYLRPLECQLTIPHPIWIDLVVWPKAREGIIKHMDWSEFLTLRAISNKSITINWSLPQSSVFTATSPQDCRLDPVFEAHIRNPSNWTVGPELAERFPFLDCIPLTVEK